MEDVVTNQLSLVMHVVKLAMCHLTALMQLLRPPIIIGGRLTGLQTLAYLSAGVVISPMVGVVITPMVGVIIDPMVGVVTILEAVVVVTMGAEEGVREDVAIIGQPRGKKLNTEGTGVGCVV